MLLNIIILCEEKMKTFKEFIRNKETDSVNENIARIIPSIASGAWNLGKNIAGKAFETGKNIAGAVGTGIAINSISDLFKNADTPEEAEEILKDKIEKEEKEFRANMETNLKNFSLSLSNNLTKTVKTITDEFRKKVDASIREFMN